MKSRIVTFATGAALGALAMFFASRPATEPVEAPAAGGSAARSIHPDRQEQKIASLEKKIAELEAAQPEPDRDEVAKSPGEASGSIQLFGAGSESKIDLTEMQKHMREAESERAAKRVAADLASLSSALSLTDEQVERVRALLERREAMRTDQMGGILRLAKSALSGDGSESEAIVSGFIAGAEGSSEEDSDGLDFDAELLALLEPEQADAYRSYQESQNENRIEASANSQLARLQTTVPDLTKDQKDRAFDEFARIARENSEGAGVPEQGFSTSVDLGRMMTQREAEKQAMKDILSPEQYDV
ncbi:MAG: hypothetical protein ACR2RV_04705, partial [Verrucomicrobiales bacterium]